MIIYLILIILLILLYIFFKNNRKKFCIFSGMLFFLLVALRNVEIGINDTLNVYYPMFLKMQEYSFSEIFFNPNLSGEVFFAITKVLGMFISNFQIYLAIVGIPYIFCVFYFINKHSKHILLSTIIFLSLYYLYSFFLLRQVIAMGILLLSYDFLKDKKPLKFVITVLIATLFHQTAIVFLFAYPFCVFNKFGKKNYFYIIIFYILANILPQFIFFLIDTFDFTGNLANYIRHGIYDTSGSVSMFGLLITVVMLVFANFYKKKSSFEDDLVYNLSTVGSVLFSLSGVVSEFYRLALFFSIFNIILIPNVIENEKNKFRKNIFIFGIVFISVLYFLVRSINNINANPYMFFWR